MSAGLPAGVNGQVQNFLIEHEGQTLSKVSFEAFSQVGWAVMDLGWANNDLRFFSKVLKTL